MERKNRFWVRLAGLTCTMSMMFYMCAYADDAITDILDQPRFGGAVKWVNWIGNLVDNWFMAVISFVSFFIISASCLRNVLAGAYCVFPKFWDAVYEAHQMTDAITISSAGGFFKNKGYANTSVGSISKFLLGLLPNIKVLTDFEGAQDIDYKQYFMKAIPQCAIAVFLGVFIYNGLYKDVFKVTSRFGVSAMTHALTAVKPEAIVEQLTNIVVNIPYPIKNAEYGTDYIADTYFKEVIGYVNDKYTDQNTRENKEILYQNLSKWCHEYFQANFSQYSNTEIWKPSIDKRGAGIQNYPMDEQTVTSQDGLEVVKLVQTPVSALNLNTEIHEEWYLWAYVKMTNKGASTSTAGISINDLTLIIPLNSAGGTAGSSIRFDAQGSGTLGSGTGTVAYGGYEFDVSVNTTAGNGAVTMVPKSNMPSADTPLAMSGRGMSYNDGKLSNNVEIKRIIFTNNVSTAQLQCMYSGANAGVQVPFGGELAGPVREYTNSHNAGSGGGGSTTEADEGDDGGLEDAD